VGGVGTPEVDRMLPRVPYTITRYPLPATAPTLPVTIGPFDLVSDRHGNLWFNFLGYLGTGEISVFGSHQISIFPTGGGEIGHGPRDDPNSIWFIASYSPPYAIGRIDTITHEVTRFPIALTASPADIDAGPDGNIWITGNRTGYEIGRFNPRTHVFTEIPLPDDTYAIGLTCGPDGNEWFSSNVFSDSDNPQGTPAVIGRVDLGGESERDHDRGCLEDGGPGPGGLLNNLLSTR
jgi:hypothetical protein